MKKVCFISAVFLFLISTGCRKESTASYTGDWNFRAIGNYWNMNPFPVGTVWSDTTLYAGQITSGEGKTELVVYYRQDEFVTVVVNSDGKIDSTWEKSGQFDGTDHLTLVLKSPQSALGGGYTKTVTGWR